MIPFKPATGRILLEVIKETTALSYAKADDVEPIKKGKVLAIGTDYQSQFGAVLQAPCKVGDIISHETVGYEKIEWKGVEYRVLDFTKVLGSWTK